MGRPGVGAEPRRLRGVGLAALVVVTVAGFIGLLGANNSLNGALAKQSKEIWLRNYQEWGALSGYVRRAEHAQTAEEFAANADRYIALADSVTASALPAGDRVASDVSGIAMNTRNAVIGLRDARTFPLDAKAVAFLDHVAAALEQAGAAASIKVSGAEVPADLETQLDFALNDSAAGVR
jgi:hypothetical protein